MLGLGIESTAHTFTCAVLEKKGKKGVKKREKKCNVNQKKMQKNA